jgi:hypothetical protein
MSFIKDLLGESGWDACVAAWFVVASGVFLAWSVRHALIVLRVKP